ncbi:TPA: TraI domain-containing protein [Salmonella enterica]|uniref:TraI domain-containing protein n=1 Tax=Salmonella enterica TaxID=28901 RepID=UPI0009B0080A|nr:TraI domain-containing protein [Salmonella enterica]HBD1844085.1 TraI domain-containing protein [Salmonella enterica]
MFNRLKSIFNTKEQAGASAGAVSVDGFFLPQTIHQLIDTPERKSLMKQLWENCNLPADLYQRLYLAPLQELFLRTQTVPAEVSGPWAYMGGFSDMTLAYSVCVVRQARGYMFPPGAAPEEQSAQNVLWNAVIFWSALFYHLPLLCNLEGELQDGKKWLPGLIPEGPFRFRFSEQVPDPVWVRNISSVLAIQILPQDVLPWISNVPAALACLTESLCRSQAPLTIPLIGELLLSGAQIIKAPHLNLKVQNNQVANLNEDVVIQPKAFIEMETILVNSDASAIIADSAVDLISAIDDSSENLNVNSENPVIEHHTEDNNDTQMLIEMFGGDESKNAPESPDRENEDHNILTMSLDIDVASSSKKPNVLGTDFFNWLSNGLIEGIIEINHNTSRVHIVAGYVFLCVPEIFYFYIKSTGSKTKRNAIQSAFERLGKHRISEGERFFQARVYSNPYGTGSFRPINGYLVKINHIYKDHMNHCDSPFLVLP